VTITAYCGHENLTFIKPSFSIPLAVFGGQRKSLEKLYHGMENLDTEFGGRGNYA
jgi:hypothetical protein